LNEEDNITLNRSGATWQNPFITAIIQESKNGKGSQMNNYINLLETNHNLILTGAPGTGKTYLAKQIATRMIFSNDTAKASLDSDKLEGEDKNLFYEHFCFVQFHPSYDYTDFVEGLRPTEPDEHGNIGFKLKNGVFKEFCKRAQEAQRQETLSGNFDEAWQKFLQNLGNHSLDDHSSLKISEGLSVKLTSRGSVKDINPYFGTYTRQNIYNVYRGLKGRNSGAFDNRMKKIRDYLKKECNLKDCDEKGQKQFNLNEAIESIPPYIFVIDEINRGEISKIFGEIFFSIDPGYRGKKGKVQTQYANIQSDDTIFDEDEGPGWFYIPENIYIIGTMNDIDRSLESMDFAMRRRFTWVEVTAEESAENMMLSPDIKERMSRLNDAIEKIEGLNSSYHIGGSYFLKLKDITPDELWEYHLKSLLHEYLRGMPDAESQLKKLENAYKLKQEDDSNNG
jgi:5-methylcytosine-specific restriction endonuclease McrBC GTP-binding regulatory subunit McrB